MIISGKQIQSILKAYGDNKVSKPVKTEKKGSGQQPDEVVLSTQAQEISQILQSIKKHPEIREEKVAELAERIQSGNYNVDAKEIADKMIGRALADKLR